jgi:hypothetical protein
MEPTRLPTLDESFPRRYEARAKGELSTPDDLLYFPGRPGLIVEVTPKPGKRWTAVFGQDSPGFLTGLYTTPDDGSLCVVSSGRGYFVEAADPISWFQVESRPIRLALPFPEHGLLIFGNFTDFIAYRFDGASIDVRLAVAWRSGRLGWDELEVSRVTPDRIEGRAWYAPEDCMLGYSLDVQTGEHQGGAYPPDASEQLEP